VASFQCEIDGGGYTACTSPKSYAGPLLEGSHTFHVKSIDNATNESTVASFTWKIDTNVPTVSITAQPTDPSN
jgi:hypothetical protein